MTCPFRRDEKNFSVSLVLKEKEMKSRREMAMLWGSAALLLLSTAVFAQLPPAADVVPAGFKVEAEHDLGGTKMITARKPNDNFPKAFLDQGIELQISWQSNPAADMILDMLAKQPEDPAGQVTGSSIREEPCGRQPYRDGILSCRKVIMPYIGQGSSPDLVTWRVGWTGKGKDGLVSVGVDHFFGAKETAMAWIDAIIPKITK
jgi:hypothetical protein